MLHLLRALLWIPLLAGPAGAATLTVTPDKLIYNVGETITLTVTADDEGAVAYSVFGRLRYSGALVDNGNRTQTLLGPTWVPNALFQEDDGVDALSDAFGQINVPGPETAQTLPGTLSTVTLIAQAVGVVDVEWQQPIFAFFGLTNPQGTSFTIVPEPATGALLAIGLFTLTLTRRKERTSCGR